MMSPTVDEAFHENVALHRVRAKVQNAATAQADDPVRRLEMAMDVNGLIHVELAIVAPAQSVERVMRVFGAEAG